MKLTRTEMANGLTSKFPELSAAKAMDMTNAFCAIISDGIKAGHNIELRGVGTFKVKSYEPRKGRNPSTGETITIPAQRRVSFKAADAIAKSLKG